MSKINQVRLSGTTYQIEDSSANKTVSLTQAQYDALSTKDPNIYYIITDASGVDISQYMTSAQTMSAITEATSGKLDVTAYTPTVVDNTISSSSTNPVQNAVIYQQFGGLKLQQISQSDYDALSTKDASTLYIIVN